MSHDTEQANDRLERALLTVASAAREVSDSAYGPHHTHDGERYSVDAGDLDELREALREWTKASNAFLNACQQERMREREAAQVGG